MAKFPIVADGEWLQLWFVEGETGEAVLVAEATRLVKEYGEDFRIDPKGVQGRFTPNLSLAVQVNNEDGNGWRTNFTLTIPMYEE